MVDNGQDAGQCPFSSVPPIVYSNADFLFDSAKWPADNGFKEKFLKCWQAAAAEKGVLNYEIGQQSTSPPIRQLDGHYCLSVQLNRDRCTKRRKPHQFQKIDEQFDAGRWNFTKLRPEECLFQFCHQDQQQIAAANGHHNGGGHLAINASPLSTGHSLLLPSPQKCHRQILTADAVKMGAEWMLVVGDSRMVVIYNGLLAHASVNHLHLQTLFWPCRSGLMVKKPIVRPLNINCSKMPVLFLLQRPSWYLPAFVFQITHKCHIGQIAGILEKTVQFLIGKNWTHSLTMCRSNRLQVDGRKENEEGKGEEEVGTQFVTLYLFPRRILEERFEEDSPLAATFVPAALEVAGLIPVYDSAFFESIREEEVVRLFDQYQLISDAQFAQLAKELCQYLGGQSSC